MDDEEKIIKVFTGPEPAVFLLMRRLEEIGIESLIRNESELGYLGAVPDLLDLYILEDDLEKARPLIEKENEIEKPEE